MLFKLAGQDFEDYRVDRDSEEWAAMKPGQFIYHFTNVHEDSPSMCNHLANFCL